jgi:RNA polymerase sigma-70 factor (ECF subfamily)
MASCSSQSAIRHHACSVSRDVSVQRRIADQRTTDVDDRELLERIKQGEQEAFDAMFRRYYAPLVGVAQGMLRQRAVAEEIVQDVMFELWRRRKKLVIGESLRAYLFQSARNRALNHIRHERVERLAEPRAREESSRPATAINQLVESELDAAVREAVGALPPPCREVFELSRTSGLRYAEIARVLGISVKTVEARMGRALRGLRERLAPWLPEGSEV